MYRALAALAWLSLPLLAAPASAQDFPNRPMTMVVPFAAGGAVDVLARTLAARAAEILGQQIVIENVAGAGGMTGASRIAKAAPDGYQFVLGSVGTHAQNQWLYKQPAYNAAKDFAPVILVGSDFWGGLVEWVADKLLGDKKISPGDLGLLYVTDDLDEVMVRLGAR